MDKQEINPEQLTRFEWVVANQIITAISAYNSAFCSSPDEDDISYSDEFYQFLAEQLTPFQIADLGELASTVISTTELTNEDED